MPHLYEGKPVKYIASEKLWADNEMIDAGREFSYEGRPTPAMLPVCEEGVKRSAEAREYEKHGYLKDTPVNEFADPVAAEAAAAAAKKAEAKLKASKAGKKTEEELA